MLKSKQAHTVMLETRAISLTYSIKVDHSYINSYTVLTTHISVIKKLQIEPFKVNKVYWTNALA
uniref:Uncharacterized protein n=1 Tax=Anguilla anguilla TaxID=7936 RepID=A0A0E9WX92_ANGAN